MLYTLKELAEKTGRNYQWLHSKVAVIAAACGCKKAGRNYLFPESAVRFVNETWSKRAKKISETEFENGN